MCAGVIIHPTSLPGPFGIGEIGEEAFRLVDWMVSAGLSLWQVRMLETSPCCPMFLLKTYCPCRLCPALPACMHASTGYIRKMSATLHVLALLSFPVSTKKISATLKVEGVLH